MRVFHIIVGLAFVAMAYFGYKAWVSMPDRHVNNARVFQASLTKQEADVQRRRVEFKKLQGSDQWEFLAPYAEKEKWAAALSTAETKLAEAVKVNTDAVQPILKRDHKDDQKKLLSALDKGIRAVRDSKKAAQIPELRSSFILKSRDNKDAYFENAKALWEHIDTQASSLSSRAIQLAKVYPHQTAELSKRVSEAEAMRKAALSHTDQMREEYHSNTTDFARYGGAYNDLQGIHQEVDTYTTKQQAEFAQLDRTYVKVLADQKVDYYVVIGRAAWCESDNCGEGSSMRYPPVKVDENTFEYFDNYNGDLIATEGFWSGFKLKIPESRWNALNINKDRARSRNYKYAEFWIDKTYEKAYHRYTVVENGKGSQTQWASVSSALFWKHYDDLGMAIESKPLGYFEQETITEAEPAGMAMIAEPTMVNGVPTGSNQYGEWRHENGNSFWHYYGMYRLFGDLAGGGFYSYSDWRGYRNHGRRSAYYGEEEQYGTYGSATYGNWRYSDSEFSKRNPSAVTEARSGRSRKTNASVRGAGPNGRGKGPSGAGK